MLKYIKYIISEVIMEGLTTSKLLQENVKNLSLSNRTLEILNRLGIQRIDDIAKLDRQELLTACINLGLSYEDITACVDEIEIKLYSNNLCLEEYIRALSRYTADGERLLIETDDGEKYTVYSAAVSGDSAKIYVPKKHAYTVSGDNCGRVIVSYKVS